MSNTDTSTSSLEHTIGNLSAFSPHIKPFLDKFRVKSWPDFFDAASTLFTDGTSPDQTIILTSISDELRISAENKENSRIQHFVDSKLFNKLQQLIATTSNLSVTCLCIVLLSYGYELLPPPPSFHRIVLITLPALRLPNVGYPTSITLKISCLSEDTINDVVDRLFQLFSTQKACFTYLNQPQMTEHLKAFVLWLANFGLVSGSSLNAARLITLILQNRDQKLQPLTSPTLHLPDSLAYGDSGIEPVLIKALDKMVPLLPKQEADQLKQLYDAEKEVGT